MAKQDSASRWYKPQAVQAALPALTATILRQRGIYDPALLLHWRSIIGEPLASTCTLDKITYVGQNRHSGTLFVRCKPQHALDVLHQQTLLLERVNIFFGYKAIAHVKIIQHSS